MKHSMRLSRQRGLTLVELMVAVAITMFVVAAAGYVYLATRETQRSVERISGSAETGAFAIQLLGRDLMNAGAYPTTMPPVTATFPTRQQFDTYPPTVGVPPRATDWISPGTAYLTPVFGCEGAQFNPSTGTCGTTVAGAPDSLVINYFTSDPLDAFSGQRRDCTGADVADDPTNAKRKLNTGGVPPTGVDNNLAPQLPLFASNRYVLSAVQQQQVEGATVSTRSLMCAGNGAADPSVFQPIISGIEDMQFTYGVYSTDATRAPERFYTATEMAGLSTVTIDGTPLTPWARVVAIRVCLMTQTLGASPKIADKAGSQRTYTNCSDQVITQAATDMSLHQRHIEVFSLRNRMNQTF